MNYSFTKIPYSFFEGDNRIYPDELYIYLKLTTLKLAINDITYTNIDLISQEIKLSTRNDRNKKRIKEIIKNLNKKGLINYIIQEELNNSLLLKITFPHLNIDKEEDKNFVIATFDEFNKFNKLEELFVYLHIKKWNKLGCRKSFEEWAELLGFKSTRTVKDLLYSMNDRNIINIHTGAYYLRGEEFKQEVNQYSNTVEGEKSVKHKNKKENEFGTLNSDMNELPKTFKYDDQNYLVEDIRNNIMANEKGRYLQKEDYAYVQEYGKKDIKVKKIFDRKFNAMKNSKNEWTQGKIKEFENTYKLWKNKRIREDLLNEHNIVLMIKDEYKVFSWDEVYNSDKIFFRGIRKNSEFGIDEFIIENADCAIQTKFYLEKDIKKMVERILEEGKNVDVSFVGDYEWKKDDDEEEIYVYRRTNENNIKEEKREMTFEDYIKNGDI